jgi:hypothetical protein
MPAVDCVEPDGIALIVIPAGERAAGGAAGTGGAASEAGAQAASETATTTAAREGKVWREGIGVLLNTRDLAALSRICKISISDHRYRL